MDKLGIVCIYTSSLHILHIIKTLNLYSVRKKLLFTDNHSAQTAVLLLINPSDLPLCIVSSTFMHRCNDRFKQ